MIQNLVIVTASHNSEILRANLLRSEIVKEAAIFIKEGFTNIPKAYNELYPDSRRSDIVMFVHHDVHLPPTFESELKQALMVMPLNWGVIGCAGTRLSDDNSRTFHGYINDRSRPWGYPLERPEPVQTLDELILIVNMASGLKFDEQFEQDFYGADICMQAHKENLGVYVIPGFVNHNSNRPFGGRTPSFFTSKNKFEAKWKNYLPIATTCALCTHSN